MLLLLAHMAAAYACSCGVDLDFSPSLWLGESAIPPNGVLLVVVTSEDLDVRAGRSKEELYFRELARWMAMSDEAALRRVRFRLEDAGGRRVPLERSVVGEAGVRDFLLRPRELLRTGEVYALTVSRRFGRGSERWDILVEGPVDEEPPAWSGQAGARFWPSRSTCVGSAVAFDAPVEGAFALAIWRGVGDGSGEPDFFSSGALGGDHLCHPPELVSFEWGYPAGRFVEQLGSAGGASFTIRPMDAAGNLGPAQVVVVEAADE